MFAEQDLSHGNKYPFDAPNSWWQKGDEAPPPPKDWAEAAARGVIASLQLRGGLNHILTRDIDEETRKEIIEELADIIWLAQKQES